jgi:hypothetical protein
MQGFFVGINILKEDRKQFSSLQEEQPLERLICDVRRSSQIMELLAKTKVL